MTSRDFLPSFLKKKYQELDEHPELNMRYEKITDFLWLIKKIWWHWKWATHTHRCKAVGYDVMHSKQSV